MGNRNSRVDNRRTGRDDEPSGSWARGAPEKLRAQEYVEDDPAGEGGWRKPDNVGPTGESHASEYERPWDERQREGPEWPARTVDEGAERKADQGSARKCA
jgi:hypothetical protein